MVSLQNACGGFNFARCSAVDWRKPDCGDATLRPHSGACLLRKSLCLRGEDHIQKTLTEQSRRLLQPLEHRKNNILRIRCLSRQCQCHFLLKLGFDSRMVKVRNKVVRLYSLDLRIANLARKMEAMSQWERGLQRGESGKCFLNDIVNRNTSRYGFDSEPLQLL